MAQIDVGNRKFSAKDNMAKIEALKRQIDYIFDEIVSHEKQLVDLSDKVAASKKNMID